MNFSGSIKNSPASALPASINVDNHDDLLSLLIMSVGNNSFLDDENEFSVDNINDTLDGLNNLLKNFCKSSIKSGFGASAAERKDAFGFIIEGILLTSISTFGLLGNIVTIIVLSRPSMKGSFSSLLIGLSSFDLLYLTMSIAIFGLPSLSAWYARTVYVFVLPMGFGMGHIGRVGSVFITMSVTIERYFAIVHPLRHFSGKRFLLLTPILSSIVYNIPKFFELERTLMNNTSGEEMYEVYASSLRGNSLYVTYYIFWSKFLLVELIPYLLIVVLNTLIVIKIWKSNKFRRRFVASNGSMRLPQHTIRHNSYNVSHFSGNGQDGESSEMTARQKREANLGIVLVSISVLFIVCQSVKIIPDMYEVFTCRLTSNYLNITSQNTILNECRDRHSVSSSHYSQVEEVRKCATTPLLNSLVDISHLLLAINSSVNVIIYTWRGEKFREALTKTFGFRCGNNLQASRYTASRIEMDAMLRTPADNNSVMVSGQLPRATLTPVAHTFTVELHSESVLEARPLNM